MRTSGPPTVAEARRCSRCSTPALPVGVDHGDTYTVADIATFPCETHLLWRMAVASGLHEREARARRFSRAAGGNPGPGDTETVSDGYSMLAPR
jgi:hypothetical protein